MNWQWILASRCADVEVVMRFYRVADTRKFLLGTNLARPEMATQMPHLQFALQARLVLGLTPAYGICRYRTRMRVRIDVDPLTV